MSFNRWENRQFACCYKRSKKASRNPQPDGDSDSCHLVKPTQPWSSYCYHSTQQQRLLWRMVIVLFLHINAYVRYSVILSRNGCIYIVQVLDINIFYCQINDISLQNNYLVCLVLFCLYITFWSSRIYILHSGISKYTSDFEFHVITNQTLSLSLYNTLLFCFF